MNINLSLLQGRLTYHFFFSYIVRFRDCEMSWPIVKYRYSDFVGRNFLVLTHIQINNRNWTFWIPSRSAQELGLVVRRKYLTRNNLKIIHIEDFKITTVRTFFLSLLFISNQNQIINNTYKSQNIFAIFELLFLLITR